MQLTGSRSGSDRHITAMWSLSRAWASVLVVAALLLIFALDRVTGSAPVQHLYYLPIIFAALRFGRPGGLIVALAAILSYHLANAPLVRFQYGESDIVQIALFVAVGVVTAKLRDDGRHLRLLAMSDDLTGLHNLRSFEPQLARMVCAAREGKAPLSLLVLDVDHLKSLNDKYGHLAGGDAVRTVGQIIGACLPPDAVACRYGGDEFVVALPRCTESQASRVADDLRRAVSAAAPVLAALPFAAGTLSISIGLACMSPDQGTVPEGWSPTDDEAGEALFRAADEALYAAKGNGRNCVCTARISAPVRIRATS
jgi:diguanylate cyclase (GGDEF)-like protein